MGSSSFGDRREIVPTLDGTEAGEASRIVEALAAGGVRYVEVLLRSRPAWSALKSAASVPGVSVGAGTITDAWLARRARDAGATFLVSPGFDVDLVTTVRTLGVPYVPGVATASDCMRALSAGFTDVKFFPAEHLGGAGALGALAGAFPELRFMPTGGIDEGTLGGYVALTQVFAVGGSWLVDPARVGAGDFDRITMAAQSAVSLLEGRAA